MNRLYYISQGVSPEQHLNNIQLVAENGIRWIQLRLKDYSDDIVRATAKKALVICRDNDAQLFINDYVDIANEIGADGVHIGQEDIAPLKAKSIFKEGLLGGTANTLEQCLILAKNKVDYIGLGPFRFTGTKKKLSPILGLEGIHNIIKELRLNGYDTPIIAIGGIKIEDCESLFNIGVDKVAVSGLLTGKTANEIKSIAAELNELVRQN